MKCRSVSNLENNIVTRQCKPRQTLTHFQFLLKENFTCCSIAIVQITSKESLQSQKGIIYHSFVKSGNPSHIVKNRQIYIQILSFKSCVFEIYSKTNFSLNYRTLIFSVGGGCHISLIFLQNPNMSMSSFSIASSKDRYTVFSRESDLRITNVRPSVCHKANILSL